MGWGGEKAKRQQPERAVQRAVKELFERVGGKVWTLGTTRRKGDHPGTMQTPGLPDLWVILPGRGPYGRLTYDCDPVPLWFECKSARGKLSPAQQHFRTMAHSADVYHLHGGIDEAIKFLKSGGWLKS